MFSNKRHYAFNILQEFLGFLDEVVIQKISNTGRGNLNLIRLIDDLVINILPLREPLNQALVLHMLKNIKPVAFIDIKELVRHQLFWIYILARFQALIEISKYLIDDNVVIILSHSSSISVFIGGSTWQK